MAYNINLDQLGQNGGAYGANTDLANLESNIVNQLSGIGNSVYSWAQNAYNQAAGVTDQQIQQYNQLAQQGEQQASNLWGRYQNTYEPLSNQWIQEAGSYASTPRIQFNMGQAQSTAGQAANQGMINAQQTLQSYGIDPSSGRYAELEQAGNAQKAATEAGAGQQAEQYTEQTGRNMLQQAIAQGQSLPGDVVNAMNSSYQGVAGAENAALGLANTGVALQDSAAPYLSAAMNERFAPLPYNRGGSSGAPGITDAGGGGGGMGGGGGGGGTMRSGGGGGYYGMYSNAPTMGNYGTIPEQGGTYGNSGTGTLPYSGVGTMGGYGGGAGASAGGYAAGGEAGVLPTKSTTGGFVPRGASPSGGAQTDDIPARLNAREFVMPQDVTDWKGQEFFQKLIQQSRQARQKMAADGQMAHGTPKPSLAHMQPRFVSHAIPPQTPQGAPNGG